jgi:hypothetical protein
LLVIAIFLVGLAGAIPAGSAHSEEDCLAAPNGRAPPGSRWLFRTDHTKQRKCWHLQAPGEKAEAGAATTPRPAANRAQNPPDRLEDKRPQAPSETTAGLRGSTAPASTPGGGADRLAPPPWPAPPPAAPDQTAWPNPPSQVHAADVPWPAPPAAAAADKTEDPQAPIPDRNLKNDAGSETEVAATASISQDRTFLGLILIFAATLVVVGILLVRWVRVMFANTAPEGDARRALRKLLEVLEQQAPT